MIPLIWNFFRRWGLRSQIAGLSAWKVLRLFCARAFNSIYFGAAALLVTVVAGVALGYIGYKLEAKWLTGFGQMLIATGGMIATGILMVFYLRSIVATHALTGLDALAAKLTFGRSGHFFTKENGANLRNDLLNAFAWVAAFCLWCDFVPVWKLPIAIPIGVTLAAFFAFASAKSWTFVQRPFGKAVVFAFLAVMFLLHTANICLGGAMSEWSSAKGDLGAATISAFAAGDRGRQMILEERASFEDAKAEVQLAEYRALARRQLQLMKHGRTAAEQEEFRHNAKRMRILEFGPPARARARTAATTVSPIVPQILPLSRNPPRAPASGAMDGFTDWLGANWANILVCIFIASLAALLVAGLATKQKWLAGTALACLLLIGFCGLGYWASKRVSLPNPAITITRPTVVAPMRAGTGGTVRMSAPEVVQTRSPSSVSRRQLGLRQGLNEIVPEAPGEWQ